jgi:hypothetical protein
MFNKNRILCKFSNVGIPDIISSNDRIQVSSIDANKSENKIVEIDVIVDQEKGALKG